MGRGAINVGDTVVLTVNFADYIMQSYTPNKFPEVFTEYTVRTVSNRNGVVYIRLNEIVNEVNTYLDGTAEIEFDAYFFIKCGTENIKQPTPCTYIQAPCATYR